MLSCIPTQGKRIKQPFRKGLGYALQWYDCVRVEIERLKDHAVASKFTELFKVPSGMDPKDTPAPSSRSLTPEDLGAEECHRILQLRCSACFGGKKFGCPFKEYVRRLAFTRHLALTSHQWSRHSRCCRCKLQPPTLTISRNF